MESEAFGEGKRSCDFVVAEIPTDDGETELIGFAMFTDAYECHTPVVDGSQDTCGHIAYIRAFYVSPAYREHGIGMAILKAAVKSIWQRGRKKLQFRASSWNTASTEHFYRKGARQDDNIILVNVNQQQLVQFSKIQEASQKISTFIVNKDDGLIEVYNILKTLRQAGDSAASKSNKVVSKECFREAIRKEDITCIGAYVEELHQTEARGLAKGLIGFVIFYCALSPIGAWSSIIDTLYLVPSHKNEITILQLLQAVSKNIVSRGCDCLDIKVQKTDEKLIEELIKLGGKNVTEGEDGSALWKYNISEASFA